MLQTSQANLQGKSVTTNALSDEERLELARLAYLSDQQGMSVEYSSKQIAAIVSMLKVGAYINHLNSLPKEEQYITPMQAGCEIFFTSLTFFVTKFLAKGAVSAYYEYSRDYYKDQNDWGYNQMKDKIFEIDENRLNTAKKFRSILKKTIGDSRYPLLHLSDESDFEPVTNLRKEQIEKSFKTHSFRNPIDFARDYQKIHHKNPFIIQLEIPIFEKNKEVNDFIEKNKEFSLIKKSFKKAQTDGEQAKLLVEIVVGNPELLYDKTIGFDVLLDDLKKIIREQKKYIPRTKEPSIMPVYSISSLPDSSLITPVAKEKNLENIQENFNSFKEALEAKDFAGIFSLDSADEVKTDSKFHLKFDFDDEEICEIFKSNLGKFGYCLNIKDVEIEELSRRGAITTAKTIDKNSFTINFTDTKLDQDQLNQALVEIETQINRKKIKDLDKLNDELVAKLSGIDNPDNFKVILTELRQNNVKITELLGQSLWQPKNNFERTFPDLFQLLTAKTDNQFEFSPEFFKTLKENNQGILDDKKFFSIQEDADVVKVRFNRNIAFRSDFSIRDYALEKFTSLETAIQQIPLAQEDKSEEVAIPQAPIPGTDPIIALIKGDSQIHENHEILEAVNIHVKFYAEKSSQSSVQNIGEIKSTTDFSFGILNEIQFNQSTYRERETKLKGIFHEKLDELARKITTDAENPLPAETEDRAKSLIYFLLNYSSGDAEAVAKDIHYLQERGDFKGYHYGLGHASGNDATQLKKLIITLDKLTEFADDKEKLSLEKLEDYHQKIIKKNDRELQIVEKTADELVDNLCNLLEKYPPTDTLKFAKNRICQLVFDKEISVQEFIEKKAEIIENLKRNPEKFDKLKQQFDERYSEGRGAKGNVAKR